MTYFNNNYMQSSAYQLLKVAIVKWLAQGFEFGSHYHDFRDWNNNKAK